MSKNNDNPNVKPLLVPPVKSTPQVMMILREAITHARHHRMQAVFVVMVPEDGRKVNFMKAATPLTSQDIDILLDAVEEGHEVVYQLGDPQ